MLLNQQGKDLISSLLNQVWRLLSGPIILLLIPFFITEIEQGYWFLFVSLSALSIFADLGFSNIILQFSAHEFAFLSLNDDGLLKGDDFHLKKIGSFFRFTLKWISSICIIVFPIIYFIGIWYFIRDNVLQVYLLPWSIFSIGSLLNFFNNSILSYIEGMNKIESVQFIRFRAAIINTIVISLMLVFGGTIYALSLGSIISSSTIFISIFGKFRKLLSQALNYSKDFHYIWGKEILPLFSKYAISFSSGYFIFQIYTPLMQYFHGPVQSGKIGLTLSLVMAIFSVSNIWMYTITPQMNILVSKKNKSLLDSQFKKRLILSIGTYLFIVVALFAFGFLFRNTWLFLKITNRFLPFDSLITLLTCYFLQLIVNSLALYLRAHKAEPFVLPSLFSALWIALTTSLIGKYFPSSYFFLGFLSSYIWVIPVCSHIFFKCQKEWYAK